MDLRKLIFCAAIIAIIFGNVYAGKYTLHIIHYTTEIIKLLIYKSYIIVNNFKMYIRDITMYIYCLY